MTERLKNTTPEDPALEELSALCRRVPSSQVDAAMRARVSMRLVDAPPVRRAALRPRLAVVLTALLVASAALAAFGPIRRAFGPRPDLEPATPRVGTGDNAPASSVGSLPLGRAPDSADAVPKLSADPETRQPPRRRRDNDGPRVTTSPPRPARADAVTAEVARDDDPGAGGAHDVPAIPSPRDGEATPPRASSPLEESRLVHAAARALRVDHDPRRALRQLDDYLAIFPDGVIFEEALALSIEASLALHDARAAGLAKRYLARFPAGRFSALARSAMESGQ